MGTWFLDRMMTRMAPTQRKIPTISELLMRCPKTSQNATAMNKGMVAKHDVNTPRFNPERFP